MKFAIVLLTGLFISIAVGDPPDDFIDSLFTEHNIIGLAACAYSGDSLIWDGYFGIKNFSYTDSTVNDSTLFYVWSATKPITALVFMQLWELGLVDLDADINDYLPYEIHNPYFPETPITPRMLMSHTSSLRAAGLFYTGEPEAGDSTYSNTAYIEQVYVPGGIWYNVADNFYNYEPGSSFDYNNHRSNSVLAAIVEQVSVYSDSFDLHCAEYLFDPLEMNQTSYLITSVDTLNVAVPYSTYGGSTPYGCYPSTPSYAGWLLKTNPAELARPLIACMQGGEIEGTRILQEATVDTIMKIQYPALNPFWGLGWRRITGFSGRTIWGHYGNGSSEGGNTAMYFCPAENSAVIVMQNYGPTSVRTAVMSYLFDYVAEQMGAQNGYPPSVAELAAFPNPFTSTTTINFTVQTAGPVSLNVFDISGRQVVALIDNILSEGQHSVVCDGSVLSPGVYFYHLETINGHQTGKFMRLE